MPDIAYPTQLQMDRSKYLVDKHIKRVPDVQTGVNSAQLSQYINSRRNVSPERESANAVQTPRETPSIFSAIATDYFAMTGVVRPPDVQAAFPSSTQKPLGQIHVLSQDTSTIVPPVVCVDPQVASPPKPVVAVATVSQQEIIDERAGGGKMPLPPIARVPKKLPSGKNLTQLERDVA